MSTITKIEEQKKRPGRVNLYIDGVFAVGLTEKLVIDYDLYRGKELTEKEIERIKSGESASKCLDKAYRYLSYRPRSEKEMRDKLGEKFGQEIVDETIEKLRSYNFVNDEEFARMWVAERKTGKSARALSYELKRKGIAKDVIETSLVEVDREFELESAMKLVKSKSKYRGLTGDEAYQKIGGFLSRKGYNYEIIKKVLNEISKP